MYSGNDKLQGLDLIGRVPEELWTEVLNFVQDMVTKTILKKKNCKKIKWLSKGSLQIAEKRREVKKKEKYTQMNAEFQTITR